MAQKNCSHWSPRQWDKELKKIIVTSLPKINPDPTHQIRNLFEKIRELRKNCAKEIAELGLGPCLERITGFTKQFNWNSKNGYFSTLYSDHEYYARQPKKRMELPKELKTAPRGLPKNWTELAKKKGWKWAHFSADTGNEARLVMYIPGESEDYNVRLVYFSYDSANIDPTTYDGLQMQMVEWREMGKKEKLKSPKVHYKYWKFLGHQKRPLPVTNTMKCVKCHPNGPRKIVPKSKPHFPTTVSDEMTLEEFNKLIVVDEPVDHSEIYDIQYFPTHLLLGMKGNCIDCHNSYDRNSLVHALSVWGNPKRDVFWRKVIEEKSMPSDGTKLTHDERIEVINGIDSDYKDGLLEWFTQKSCFQANKDHILKNITNANRSKPSISPPVQRR